MFEYLHCNPQFLAKFNFPVWWSYYCGMKKYLGGKELKSQNKNGKLLIFPCTQSSTDNTHTTSPTPCHDLRYYLRQEERKRWLMWLADKESENQSTAQLSLSLPHLCWLFSSSITGKVWWLLQRWWSMFWNRHPLRWQIRLWGRYLPAHSHELKNLPAHNDNDPIVLQVEEKTHTHTHNSNGHK